MGYSMRAAEAHERGNREESEKILEKGIIFYSERLLTAIGNGIEEDDMTIVLALVETIAQSIRMSLPLELAAAADTLKPRLSVTSVKIPVGKRKREDDKK